MLSIKCRWIRVIRLQWGKICRHWVGLYLQQKVMYRFDFTRSSRELSLARNVVVPPRGILR